MEYSITIAAERYYYAWQRWLSALTLRACHKDFPLEVIHSLFCHTNLYLIVTSCMIFHTIVYQYITLTKLPEYLVNQTNHTKVYAPLNTTLIGIESWLHAVKGVIITRGRAGLAITDRWWCFMGSGDMLSRKKKNLTICDCIWLHQEAIIISSNQRRLSEGETCALPTRVPLNTKVIRCLALMNI